MRKWKEAEGRRRTPRVRRGARGACPGAQTRRMIAQRGALSTRLSGCSLNSRPPSRHIHQFQNFMILLRVYTYLATGMPRGRRGPRRRRSLHRLCAGSFKYVNLFKYLIYFRAERRVDRPARICGRRSPRIHLRSCADRGIDKTAEFHNNQKKRFRKIIKCGEEGLSHGSLP